MPHAFLCDFDGTISPTDIGAAFVEAFSPDGAAQSVAVLEEWKRGTLGHRELTRRQCEHLRVDEPQASEFTRRFEIDPQFAPFARAALARGDAVMVVSEGFGFYVREHLERAGLGELPWAANRAVFADGRVTAEFPFADPACDACGNCKAQHVRHYRSLGFRTVLVGDGTSDRHGAEVADVVLARRDLLAWCEQAGVPHLRFENFGDVAEIARSLEKDARPVVPRG